jgi:hypothetical protein
MSAHKTFNRYSEVRPTTEGAYLWRLPHATLPGVVVEFVTHMRERNAGYKTEVSPSFDYWDGYNLSVPAGLEWAPTDVTCDRYKTVAVRVVGVDPLPCPYCKQVPQWEGAVCYRPSGRSYGDRPYAWGAWSLKCCSWAKTPEYEDPRALVAKRDSALAALVQP